jgi:nicotinamide-nucleotide amidase
MRDLVMQVLAACRRNRLKLATAESCTGGMVAAALTDIAGSSDVVERGFVVYSNQAKTDMLGVPPALIERVGAVSEEVARAMAEGGLARSDAEICVAITGIAGPGGGTDTKPVGLVHIACARKDRDTVHERHVFPGDRAAVREASAIRALELVQQCASG